MLDFLAMMSSLSHLFHRRYSSLYYRWILLGFALFTASCQWTGSTPDSIRELTVLYTNDEHGWMEGTAEANSAANLVGLWREREGYTEDGPFLVLSGGGPLDRTCNLYLVRRRGHGRADERDGI